MMNDVSFNFGLLSFLLEYPQPDFFARLAALDNSARSDELETFRTHVTGLGVEGLQELYTRTFDLNPLCAPLVSVHLFGEESFRRSQLMAVLQESYRRMNFDSGSELPDHMAILLRYLDVAPADERADLYPYLLRAPLEHMLTMLVKKDNPYQYALRAVQLLLEKQFGKESVHA